MGLTTALEARSARTHTSSAGVLLTDAPGRVLERSSRAASSCASIRSPAERIPKQLEGDGIPTDLARA
jgi:hypothetical protein